MTGKDAPGQDRHLVLFGEESLRRGDDALGVVADLEGDDRPDVERDALLRHAFLGDLGFTHRQREEADLTEERNDEGPVAGYHAKRRVAFDPAPGYQHCLIRIGNLVTEHCWTP
ncbi:hypothetical protein MSHO_08710 [Mycobacterium shottsii]|uniref:Uncharacterized protein n=1 Tax=Mycobacterium shottsii TaxID=133549 RepID=A0A7I7L619_9MYCO|nr:hypothetical protein MSHO_08710 [Mycobacterium shottsii]